MDFRGNQDRKRSGIAIKDTRRFDVNADYDADAGEKSRLKPPAEPREKAETYRHNTAVSFPKDLDFSACQRRGWGI
jgi:hypothetical protein